jgi:hypothetical protein
MIVHLKPLLAAAKGKPAKYAPAEYLTGFGSILLGLFN